MGAPTGWFSKMTRGTPLQMALRFIVCALVVVAITALRFAFHTKDTHLLSEALNIFLIAVLAVGIRWGTRYAIFLSFLSALAFSWSLPPAKHFHVRDPRVWTLLTACLVSGIVSGQLSSQARKEALKARRSEREVRDIIETIPAVAWSAFPDGTNAYINKHWTDYTGLSAEQTAGSGWQTIIHPDDIQRHLATWRESLVAGKPFEIEVRLRRSDGEYRWHYVHGLPLRDDRGEILKWYGISTDIEDRKRAEIALRAAMEERARLAAFREEVGTALSRQEDLKDMLQRCADAMVRHLDGAFARIWTLSNDGKVLELQASAGMYTHLDGSHSRIPVGKLKIGLIAQERKPHLTNDVQNDPRVIDKVWARREKMISFAGHPLVLEDRVVGVMGMFSQKPLTESTLEALTFAAGNIAQGIERKRAEDALRRSEAYLTEAQKLSRSGSFALRPGDGPMGYWSEETFRIFGFNPQDGVPSREAFLERIHVEDRPRVSGRVVQAQDVRADYTDEYRVVLPGGAVRHVHVSAHPVFSSTGELIEIIGTHVDVTDRKRAELERERLRQLEADLAHINRVTTMGELTASLAHEVNQPIAAAATNASTCLRWLASETPNIEEARQAAKRIVKDATRAGEIISRIRQLFRKRTTDREVVNLNEIINDMVVLLRNEAARHGITMRTQLAADLPAVMGDRIQLQQVLMNLMINGIDAMKGVDGVRELTLVSQRDSHNQLLISVSDTGVGLPPNKDEIFDAFFTTKSQGTGMGLAISRSIVESHGGRLSATSNSSRGATFQFSIPVTSEAER